jgi:Protein of unknown function (DUF3489)
VVRQEPQTEWRISVAKTTKKRTQKPVVAARSAVKSAKSTKPKAAQQVSAQSALPAPSPAQRRQSASKGTPERAGSKQSCVLAMLQSAKGATIAAMMQATGWQQHSVRGFLAGVVRKRLQLNLTSDELDGARVYRIRASEAGKGKGTLSSRRAA